MSVQSFRDLEIWQRGVALTETMYKITQNFPKEEQYGLTSQMRRAAVSVPSNIAEGHIRSATKEFLYFLRVALGSLAELETQIIVSTKLGYVSKEEETHLIDEMVVLGKMIRNLQKSLHAKS